MLNGWLHRQVALGVRLASLLWSLKLIKFGSVGRTLQTGMQRALSLPSRRPKFQNRFLEGLGGDIHNQVEKTNAQWMASDGKSTYTPAVSRAMDVASEIKESGTKFIAY